MARWDLLDPLEHCSIADNGPELSGLKKTFVVEHRRNFAVSKDGFDFGSENNRAAGSPPK